MGDFFSHWNLLIVYISSSQNNPVNFSVHLTYAISESTVWLDFQKIAVIVVLTLAYLLTSDKILIRKMPLCFGIPGLLCLLYFGLDWYLQAQGLSKYWEKIQ